MCLSAFLSVCAAFAQVDDVLCRGGSGNFTTDFHGIAAHVGSSKQGGFGTRSCEATLSWGDQKIVVATGAWEVDLDSFGVDLGIGVPVAAFQVKKSDSDCCRTYLIYSLETPPRLLRTLSGGSSFSTSDKDLDSRVEIWTDDAAAMDGFDDLAASEMDSPPPVVLHFEESRLMDVGVEFQSFFDQRISGLRTQLDQQDLRDFKSSDGRLKLGASLTPERMHRLRRVKIAVLEMVWAYLDSGRERQAWSALADLWPSADLDRVRAAIAEACARGIHAQVDGALTEVPRKKKRADVFDVTHLESERSEVTPPRAILLWRPPPRSSDQGLTTSEVLLDLIVDAAGKVRSVEPAGSTKSIDADLMTAAMAWKFIPAMRGGHAVASRTRMAFSARR